MCFFLKRELCEKRWSVLVHQGFRFSIDLDSSGSPYVLKTGDNTQEKEINSKLYTYLSRTSPKIIRVAYESGRITIRKDGCLETTIVPRTMRVIMRKRNETV